jgi:hypothetical protein
VALISPSVWFSHSLRARTSEDFLKPLSHGTAAEVESFANVKDKTIPFILLFVTVLAAL